MVQQQGRSVGGSPLIPSIGDKVEVLGHNGEDTVFGVGTVEEVCRLPHWTEETLCIRIPGESGRFLRTAKGVRIVKDL